jgi:hypothetical protein
MVEVFKTNVKDCDHATSILDRIHKTFTDYTANFDLEDCDNILRVKCSNAFIEPQCIIELVQDLGFYAEVLQDKIVPKKRWSIYSN